MGNSNTTLTHCIYLWSCLLVLLLLRLLYFRLTTTALSLKMKELNSAIDISEMMSSMEKKQ